MLDPARATVRGYLNRPRRGLPPILAPSIIENVLQQLGSPRLRSTQYQSLTTWKNTGTFRLILRFDDGRDKRLIYKRAVYSLEEIPANEGLPVRQGPPERLIASIGEGPLSEFIPYPYWVAENRDERYFDYVWEDLGVQHQHFLKYQDTQPRAAVCESLAAMHLALRKQFPDHQDADLLHYDRDYGQKIWHYAISALPEYLRQSGDPVVEDFLRRQDRVSEVFLDPGFHVDRPTQVVHGDCNGTNIWVRRQDDKLHMKAVDWEWAGYGLPHADMISIIKWCSSDEKDEFLARYCDAAGLDDVPAQRRWLRRANMERAVLDAGFLAKQYLDPARSQKWFQPFIGGSLEHLLAEADALSTGKA